MGEGRYNEIIKESGMNEHTKSVEDKIQEIYNHTSDKIEQVTNKFCTQFNRQASYKEPLQKYSPTLNENISFPLNYKKPKSFQEYKTEEKLQKQKIKFMLNEGAS